jgi:tRNA threonylcarbamoyladenosine biosynthesis protein TsaE
MERLGALLAESLPAAASHALRLHLCGQLGAGKTTLARGLLRALGVSGAVRSPSYALMETYDAGGWHVLHVDLYRLAAPEDVAALGLADFDLPGCLWLVEWPERAGSALPAPDLGLSLAVEDGGHRVEMRTGSAAGERGLSRVRKSPQAINFT